MVDIDTNKSGNDKKESSSNKSKEKGKKSRGDVDTYRPSDEEMLDKDEMELSDASRNLAEGGELNYDKGKGSTLEGYVKKQINECDEFYDDIEEHIKDVDNYEEFAVFAHALFMNLGINRVGIMKVIQDDFGKSEKKALKLTDKICDKAGEKDMVVNVLRYMTKDFVKEE